MAKIGAKEQPVDPNLPSYKICVCGDGGVGKSCLTIQLVQRVFVTEYDPTIEDSYRSQFSIDKQMCVLDILDTAGQEDYSSLRDRYMRNGEGFIIVYSVTSRRTFDEVPKFLGHIKRAKDAEAANIPLILVGNKIDLAEQREVSTDEGNAFATANSMAFFETSAKTRQNVEEAFHQAVRQIWKLKGGASSAATSAVAPGKQAAKKKGGCTLQ